MEVIIQDKKKNGGFREVAQMEGIPQIGGHLTHMVRCYFFFKLDHVEMLAIWQVCTVT